jgi:hypothetical protein
MENILWKWLNEILRMDNYLELLELVDEPHMGNCTVFHPASVQGIVEKFQLRAHPIQLELDHKYYWYSPSSLCRRKWTQNGHNL